ncbi:MAG: hypothetical protein ABJA02_11840 [Acidobacteriota bacterium]
MKEFAFILVVLLVLLAVTAIRYRKQINSAIGFVRMIRDAAAPGRSNRSIGQPPARSVSELVNCAGCGTWVPRDRAIRFDAKTFYCSKQCVKVAIGD